MTACVLTVRLRTGVGVQTVTGIVDRTGVPFVPVHLFLLHGSGVLETLTSDPAGTFTAASANTNTYHVANAAAGYTGLGDAGLAPVTKVASTGTGAGASAGLTSLKAQASGGGVLYRTAQVTAVALGGFALTILTETIVVDVDVMVLALGAPTGDLQMEFLQLTTGGGVYPTSFPAAGLINPKTFAPAATGTVNPAAGGVQGWGWGWDSPQGGPGSAHVRIGHTTDGNYKYQTSAGYDNDITPPTTSNGPTVTTWGPSSLTLSSPADAHHRGYVLGGEGIRTASGRLVQPARVGPQSFAVPLDPVALWLVSVSGPPSTTLQSTNAEICLGWTDGVRQASYWMGEAATALPLQGAGYLSATSLLRFAGAGPAGPSTVFTAVATLDHLSPTGTVTIDWSVTDAGGREVLWFALGGALPPPLPPAPPGTIEPIRRLRQAPHLWDGTSGHRLKYPGFQLLVEAGAPRDTDGPMSWVLQWSDDGGHSWSHEHRIEGSRLGEHTFRFWWRRLGQSRDRVFRVVNSDDAKIVIVDALLTPDPVEGSS